MNMIMKTRIKICEECNRLYEKECHDLDLNIGDKVMFLSWLNLDYMKDHFYTINDISYKNEGLYWASNEGILAGADGEICYKVRIDTRNHEFVKL